MHPVKQNGFIRIQHKQDGGWIMTEKIFYKDATAHTVTARVLGTGTDDNGHYAILDRSCFYPEGGGQPADTGAIGETEVVDVQNVGGEIRHYTVRELAKGEYNTAIDWLRRYDHMQQHTGQHLLSAVFEDSFGLVTNSFHLGTERVSIDLDVQAISAAHIKEVERKVNHLIAQHHPIETEWVTQEQAGQLALRKQPAVEGDVRLVNIAGIDLNACGGTHLGNTAQLGLLKIIRTERAKKATRVYFLCGDRALNHFELLQSVTDQLTKSLNVPVGELPMAAAAVLSDRRAKEKQLKNMSLQLLEAEAENMQPNGNMLMKEFSGRPFKDVQQLAKLVAGKYDSLYLLFLLREDSQIRFVCAKGNSVSGDMLQVLEAMFAGSGGKVGGTADLAQGGSTLSEDEQEYESKFQNIINEIT